MSSRVLLDYSTAEILTFDLINWQEFDSYLKNDDFDSNRISESVKKGSASKPVRSTKPKAVLSEGAELKARFKKLANIL